MRSDSMAISVTSRSTAPAAPTTPAPERPKAVTRPTATADQGPATSDDQARIALPVPADPVAALAQLHSLKAKAEDPANPDPALAAALERAIRQAEEDLRRAEEEARRAEERRRDQADERRQAGRGASSPALPAEAFRSLDPAERVRRAAVESAYLAGVARPGSMGLDLQA